MMFKSHINNWFNSFWFVHDFFEKATFPACYTETEPQATLTPECCDMPRFSLPQDKVNMVRLIPPYLKDEFIPQLPCRYYSSKLIKGYCADLNGYASADHYMQENRGPKSRSKLKYYKNRLERKYDITYRVYYGAIETELYEELMDTMYGFLERRFEQRGHEHHTLKRWIEIRSKCLDLIRQKRASLFVIYNGEEPIDINLCYHYNRICINYIRSYNIDFATYRLGQIDIYKMLDWCIENGYEIFDLSYGYLPYKANWCNTEYYFENHFFYNPKQVFHKLTARTLKLVFDLKRHYRNTRFSSHYKHSGLPLKETVNGVMPSALKEERNIKHSTQNSLYNGKDGKDGKDKRQAAIVND